MAIEPVKQNNYSYDGDRPCLCCKHRISQGHYCLNCFHHSVHSTALKELFEAPFKIWNPEVKKIRLALGKSIPEFAEMFIVSVSTVEAWEAKPGTDKYREVYGSDARLMYAAAEVAKGRKMTLFRLAAMGEL